MLNNHNKYSFRKYPKKHTHSGKKNKEPYKTQKRNGMLSPNYKKQLFCYF